MPFFVFILVVVAMVIARIFIGEFIAMATFAAGVLLLLIGTPKSFFRRIVYFIRN